MSIPSPGIYDSANPGDQISLTDSLTLLRWCDSDCPACVCRLGNNPLRLRSVTDLYINPRLTIPESEIQISWARASGPGGQNVNKVNTKITLKWAPGQCDQLPTLWCRRFETRYHNRINRHGQIVLHSDKYRDQARNLADARAKLAEMLLECQSAPKPRKATKPTKGSQRRRLNDKRQRSEKKQRRQSPGRDE